jgi:hypothetical protein
MHTFLRHGYVRELLLSGSLYQQVSLLPYTLIGQQQWKGSGRCTIRLRTLQSLLRVIKSSQDWTWQVRHDRVLAFNCSWILCQSPRKIQSAKEVLFDGLDMRPYH